SSPSEGTRMTWVGTRTIRRCPRRVPPPELPIWHSDWAGAPTACRRPVTAKDDQWLRTTAPRTARGTAAWTARCDRDADARSAALLRRRHLGPEEHRDELGQVVTPLHPRVAAVGLAVVR